MKDIPSKILRLRKQVTGMLLELDDLDKEYQRQVSAQESPRPKRRMSTTEYFANTPIGKWSKPPAAKKAK